MNKSKEIKTIKQARSVTHGDISTRNSKMAGSSFGLHTDYCKTGSKLSKIVGSVCHQCYAKRGTGTYKNVSMGRLNNTIAIHEHCNTAEGRRKWVNAMVFLLSRRCKEGLHRWNDSGDLQSSGHLKAVIEIARRLPAIRFWLPSKEKRLIESCKETIPSNLCIRLSASMIGGKPPKTRFNTSTVHRIESQAYGFICPAPAQGGACKTCTACYSNLVQNVSYKKH